MPGGYFSEEEVAEVRAKYPALELKSPGVLEGVLKMQAEYEGLRVDDDFLVRITALNPHSNRIPALYEIGGRTEAIAKKRRVRDQRDLHRNVDGTACVCVKQVEKEKFPLGSHLLVFVEELAVPYLFGLNRYDQGGEWPWKDYSHGSLGLLEFYAEDMQEQSRQDIAEILATIKQDPEWSEYRKQLRKPSSKRACLCGSGKSFGKCHSRAWHGVRHLRAALERLDLNDLLT